MVYVRLADRSTRGVPAWMFDPVACSGVRLADEPVIACEALARLARLLDSGRSTAGTGVDGTTQKQTKGKATGEG